MESYSTNTRRNLTHRKGGRVAGEEQLELAPPIARRAAIRTRSTSSARTRAHTWHQACKQRVSTPLLRGGGSSACSTDHGVERMQEHSAAGRTRGAREHMGRHVHNAKKHGTCTTPPGGGSFFHRRQSVAVASSRPPDGRRRPMVPEAMGAERELVEGERERQRWVCPLAGGRRAYGSRAIEGASRASVAMGATTDFHGERWG